MEINVLAFGQIGDIVGMSSWKVTGVITSDDLIQQLTTQFPDLSKLNYAIAVNKQVISHPVILHENDAVALLPPFSGG